MRPTTSTFIVLLCTAFLIACAAEQPAPEQQIVQPPAEVPPAPEPQPEPVQEAAPETQDGNAQEIESGLDKAFGPRDEEQVITADDIVCDAEKQTMTFRFRNLDSKPWQLNQEVPFPAPKDLASVRITLNNYEMNGKTKPLVGGMELFTQSENFSDACGGVEVLEPSKEVTCTVSPVIFKTSAGFGRGANQLRVNGDNKDGLAYFTCE